MSLAPLTYQAVHYRLVKQLGAAAQYACVLCAEQARDWAYDHQDPAERVQQMADGPMAFSLDCDRYRPLCRSCHARFDNGDLAGTALPARGPRRYTPGWRMWPDGSVDVHLDEGVVTVRAGLSLTDEQVDLVAAALLSVVRR